MSFSNPSRRQFCEMARAAVADEGKGKGDYNEMLATLEEWRDSDPKHETAARKILSFVTGIRNDESRHKEILTQVVNSAVCEGI